MRVENLFILFLFLLNPYSLSYRLEPINIFKQREDFYHKYFPKFTNKLKLNYTDEKGYHCIVKEKINRQDKIFQISRNFTYSIYDIFPLKETFYNILGEIEILRKYRTLHNKILLTTRLLFDMKANITEAFILTKKYGNSEEINYSIDSFRNYLRSKSEFFSEFIKFLPQAYIFGETSWSEDDIFQYRQTGSIPVFKMELVKIYKSIIEALKNSEITQEFTKNWLNEDNISYFLSLYGYVNSKSFQINFDDSNSSEINQVNKNLEKFGGLALIPFADLCINSLQENNSDERNFQIVYKDQINILSLKEYSISEELSLTKSENLSNDILLLNHGIVRKNNPHQEFIFKFDIIDNNYSFYNILKSNGFNINIIKIIDEHKLSINFNLKSSHMSEDLFKFINIFLSTFGSRDDEKFHKIKSYRSLINSIDKSNWRRLKNNLLYYSTMEKNIKKILEDAEVKDINELWKI